MKRSISAEHITQTRSADVRGGEGLRDVASAEDDMTFDDMVKEIAWYCCSFRVVKADLRGAEGISGVNLTDANPRRRRCR